MTRLPSPSLLAMLLPVYAGATLIHFVHNAVFLAAYPGLPETWTPAGVCAAWFGMSAVGIGGWILMRRGFRWVGLVGIAVYAMLGLDSLGHYVVAPLTAHAPGMHVTILLEVVLAMMVLGETVRTAAFWIRRLHK